MQARELMAEPDLSDDFPNYSHSLRVVIAYQDIFAGRRAMRVLTNLARIHQRAEMVTPVLERLLQSPPGP